MSYVVDLTKTPLELITQLINYENKTSFPTGSIKFKNITLNQNKKTSLIAAVGSTEYNLTLWRMTLEKLFNFTEIKLVINNGEVLTDAEIITRVSQKYKINLPADSFEITKRYGSKYLIAKDTNPAYTGMFRIVINEKPPVTPGVDWTFANVNYIPTSAISNRRTAINCSITTSAINNILDPTLKTAYSYNNNTSNRRRPFSVKIKSNLAADVKSPNVNIAFMYNNELLNKRPNIATTVNTSSACLAANPTQNISFSCSNIITNKRPITIISLTSHVYTLLESTL